MKTTFKVEHPKIKLPRVADSVKHEIRTFLKKSPLKPLLSVKLHRLRRTSYQ